MSTLTPHGACLLWKPELIWLNAVSDGILAGAFFASAFVVGLFVWRRRDLMYRGVFGIFAIFVAVCGMTRLLAIVTLWVPAYDIEGLAKGENRQHAGDPADHGKNGEYPEHAAVHDIATPPHEEPDDERDGKEGAGENGVGNGIQPDPFRLPQQTRAVRGERRHVENISKKRGLEFRVNNSNRLAGAKIAQISAHSSSWHIAAPDVCDGTSAVDAVDSSSTGT